MKSPSLIFDSGPETTLQLFKMPSHEEVTIMWTSKDAVSLSVNIPASYLCSGLPYLHFTVVGFIFCFLRSMLQCLVTLCKVMWPSQASAGTAGPETQRAANWVLNVAQRKHLHSVSRWDHFTCCIQTWLITVDHYHWSRHHFPSVPVFTFYHVHFTHSAVRMSWTL